MIPGQIIPYATLRIGVSANRKLKTKRKRGFILLESWVLARFIGYN